MTEVDKRPPFGELYVNFVQIDFIHNSEVVKFLDENGEEYYLVYELVQIIKPFFRNLQIWFCDDVDEVTKEVKDWIDMRIEELDNIARENRWGIYK